MNKKQIIPIIFAITLILALTEVSAGWYSYDKYDSKNKDYSSPNSFKETEKYERTYVDTRTDYWGTEKYTYKIKEETTIEKTQKPYYYNSYYYPYKQVYYYKPCPGCATQKYTSVSYQTMVYPRGYYYGPRYDISVNYYSRR